MFSEPLDGFGFIVERREEQLQIKINGDDTPMPGSFQEDRQLDAVLREGRLLGARQQPLARQVPG